MRKILSILLLGLGVCSQAQETFNITWVMDISHEEASVTIGTGDTVLWTWGESGMPHDVSSIDPDAPDDFGSEILIGEGQTYEYTFTEEAEIDYRCSVHPNTMTGTITIVPNMSVEEKFVKNLNYYPSVVNESLNITSLIPLSQYEIFDAQGRRVAEGKFGHAHVSVINTSALSKGVYFVNVVSESKLKTSFRIIKE